MLTKAQALIDASIIYGAQRFYDGVHDDPNWPFRYKYQKEDDHILFLEFMHYALLYDQILIEGSCGSTAATAEFSRELLSFIDHVNDRCPGETRFIEEVLVGESALPQREKTNKIVQKSLCKMIARNMECGLISLDKIRQIQIPWAYFGERHHDYTDIRKACMDIGLSDEVIPFSLFVWRALLYSAFARYLSMQGHSKVAYVAAPGRLVALRAILDARDVNKFYYPRETLRELTASLPNLPSNGYEFSFLSSLPAVETSSLTIQLADWTAADALDEVCDLRQSSSIRALRKDWLDLLFAGESTCGIGGTHVQIVRDSEIHGNLVQEQKLIRAVPVR